MTKLVIDMVVWDFYIFCVFLIFLYYILRVVELGFILLTLIGEV